MRIRSATFSWSTDSGFSSATLPFTDAANLVLVFASGDLAAHWSDVLQSIDDAYPKAIVVGCSSAGEIIDAVGFDGDRLSLGLSPLLRYADASVRER